MGLGRRQRFSRFHATIRGKGRDSCFCRKGLAMRAFIAIEVPRVMQQELEGLVRQLALSCEGRFIAPENRHVTLAFLGDIDERQVASAIDAMDAAVRGAGSVMLRSMGLGKFGRSSDATLWLGLEPMSELMWLAERLREELVARDVSFDGKPFKPHLTLARRTLIPATDLSLLAFPEPCKAQTVTLFKSTLDPAGAVYKPLYSVELS